VGEHTVREGDFVAIDGTTGEVLLGEVITQPSEIIQVINGDLNAEESAAYQRFFKLMTWVDQVREIGVRPTPTPPKTLASPWLSAPRASASAAPSTCSSAAAASRPCAR
jgi:hypothetical protein